MRLLGFGKRCFCLWVTAATSSRRGAWLLDALTGGAVAVTAFTGDQQLRCYQLRDSRLRTITVADAGAPLTKPKNGPKSLVAEKPVT